MDGAIKSRSFDLPSAAARERRDRAGECAAPSGLAQSPLPMSESTQWPWVIRKNQPKDRPTTVQGLNPIHQEMHRNIR